MDFSKFKEFIGDYFSAILIVIISILLGFYSEELYPSKLLILAKMANINLNDIYILIIGSLTGLISVVVAIQILSNNTNKQSLASKFAKTLFQSKFSKNFLEILILTILLSFLCFYFDKIHFLSSDNLLFHLPIILFIISIIMSFFYALKTLNPSIKKKSIDEIIDNITIEKVSEYIKQFEQVEPDGFLEKFEDNPIYLLESTISKLFNLKEKSLIIYSTKKISIQTDKLLKEANDDLEAVICYSPQLQILIQILNEATGNNDKYIISVVFQSFINELKKSIYKQSPILVLLSIVRIIQSSLSQLDSKSHYQQIHYFNKSIIPISVQFADLFINNSEAHIKDFPREVNSDPITEMFFELAIDAVENEDRHLIIEYSRDIINVSNKVQINKALDENKKEIFIYQCYTYLYHIIIRSAEKKLTIKYHLLYPIEFDSLYNLYIGKNKSLGKIMFLINRMFTELISHNDFIYEHYLSDIIRLFENIYKNDHTAFEKEILNNIIDMIYQIALQSNRKKIESEYRLRNMIVSDITNFLDNYNFTNIIDNQLSKTIRDRIKTLERLV